MPGGLPYGIEVCNAQDVGSVTASSVGTTITTSASANTKGAYTQLIASLGADCVWMDVFFTAAARVCLVDIAVGGSGSEQPFITNMFCSPTSALTQKVSFPVCVPAGSRISARAQANTGSTTFDMKINCYDGALNMMEGAAGLDSPLGANTSLSTVPTIQPNATANTKSTYTQISSSTPNDYMGLLLTRQGGSTGRGLIDVAIGGSGSEQVIIPNIAYIGNAQLDSLFVPIPVPKSTRVAARCQLSGASGNSYSLAIQGVLV